MIDRPPLRPSELLPLTHSWPLFEQGKHFDLGRLIGSDSLSWTHGQSLAGTGIGLWECDLRDNSLIWSAETYDLFGLPRDAALSRAETVALYCEHSRTAMERLRAYAIKHRRGFTLDAQILPARGVKRWMRLVAAPICEGSRVVRLHGLKQDITHEYR